MKKTQKAIKEFLDSGKQKYFVIPPAETDNEKNQKISEIKEFIKEYNENLISKGMLYDYKFVDLKK